MSKTLYVRDLAIGQGTPKIVVPIVDKTKDGILSSARTIHAMKPDVVEWRCDWFSGGCDIDSVTDVLKDLRQALGDIPLLFTFRTSKEGGETKLDPDSYSELLKGAASTGLVDLIDVELFTGDEFVRDILTCAHDCNVPAVASSHDFERTPGKDEILARLKKMDLLGADILKIAVMPESRADVITLLDATQEADAAIAKPVVTMSMGQMGLISRLCGEAFGSALTFGSVGKTSAPGQMNAEDLRRILDLIHINSGDK
jgi:3-dehydroquinate dehydratase-1